METADQQWQWDFDEDGTSDLIVREGDDVRFLVTTDAGYETVHDYDGGDLVADVGAGTTVTCSDEGVLVQAFQAADTESSVSGLRLARLEVSDGTGSLVPSPSFFSLSDDFELGDGQRLHRERQPAPTRWSRGATFSPLLDGVAARDFLI